MSRDGYSNYCSSKVTQGNDYSKVRAASASVMGVLCALRASRAKGAVWTLL